MQDSEFLWQAITVASVLGNALQGWMSVKRANKPQKFDMENQPLEVVEGRKSATMDNIKVIHKRMDGIEKRLDKMDKENADDKKEIIDEIIKMREQSHEQFATLNRAIGRLEGERISR